MEAENAEATAAVVGLLSLASPLQQPYVSELLWFTPDRLHKEPELLRVDAVIIQRKMQEVALANYRDFISAADALVAMREEVSSIDKHLQSLIGEVPKLTFGCAEFVESGDQILEKKMNQTLLANHRSLLDLLEIPQLMDTYVRNGNYDVTLDLEAFVCKLFTMHPKAIFTYDTSGSKENYDGGLLFSWSMHQITSHLKTLKVILPKITERQISIKYS